ncbi:MAG: glycosyltransferase family 39 protein [Candidatus Shapirobacteria bacterium]|nr:glycosyltransferase family 39 protein [Candidatus Shapirobacteria bacterium]MDD3002710.1 glycosyltransferase family 39 protein [Candidatus Shapirobacteria bacterium]MDD4383211.1 glycosyltransferase family 39 protein [Candidatus Shapirobacteria bacterium]
MDRRKLNLCLILALSVFLIYKSIFFNSIISRVKQPDYDYHSAVLKIYKENPKVLFFRDRLKMQLGCDDPIIYNPPVSTSPFLYYSVVGKVWYLTNSLKITALIQSVFGIAAIFYVYFLALIVTKSRIVSFFSAIIMSSIPMFSYQINYVSYDNLVNLASIASIFYLMAFINKLKIKDLFMLFIFLLIGILTKFSFGPLMVVILTILILFLFKNFKFIKNDIFKFIFNVKNIHYILVLLFFAGLFVSFYGRNLILYKSLMPAYSYNFEHRCDL